VANWLLELNEYDYSSICLKSEENSVADALSRYAHGPTRPSLVARVISRTKQKQLVFVPKDEVDTVLRAWRDQRDADR
jgi:hypothetical protein